MRVNPSSYRDEENNIVDDLDIEDSIFERIVMIRERDGSVTIRAKPREGDTVEETFQRSNRQYSGLDHDGGPTNTVHEDIRDALFSIGYVVEPNRLSFDAEVGNDE